MVFEKMQADLPTAEELQEFNLRYQGGIELTGWFAELTSEFTNLDFLQGIHNSMEKLFKFNDFPISSYNGPRALIFELGFTLGEIFREELGWSWYYKEVYDDEYIGWMIVSPDRMLALAVEMFFDPPLLYGKLEETCVCEFFLNIKNGQIKPADDGKFTVYYSEKDIKYFD
ncbi:MAG: hypothetical protein JW982_14740 [Spirochaetes bacterium]|nr:hypothetical protein [Spirochaetota bacterium]